MSCIKIRLKNIPNVHPNLLEIDGYFYLDMEPDADMSFTKQLSELSELNTMPFDYALSIDVPATSKNNFILGKYLHKITAADRLLPCEVINGAQIFQVNLTVTQINSDSISIDLVMNDRLWAKKLSDAKLRDLEGDYMYRNDYVKQLLPQIYSPIPYIYTGTGIHARDVYYPVVDYGDLKNVTNSKLLSNIKAKTKHNRDRESSMIDACFSPLGGFPAGVEAYQSMKLGIIYLNFNDFEYTAIYFQGVQIYNSYVGNEVILNVATVYGNYTVRIDHIGGPTTVMFSTFGAYKSQLNYIGDTLNGVDFRPWHFAYPLLKRMFCNIGYDLESPILESNYGRRILTYLIDPELAETDLIDHVVDAKTLTFVGGTGTLAGEEVVLMTFNKIGIYDLKISVAFTTVGEDTNYEGYIDIYVWVMQGDKKVRHIASHSTVIPENPEDAMFYVELNGNDVALKDGQRVEVLMVAKINTFLSVTVFKDLKDSPTISNPNSKLCNSVVSATKKTQIVATHKKRFFWREFDILGAFGKLRSNTVIDRNITQLDYLKAITHLLNLKFYTDHANKKVLALQPNDIDLYGEVLDGFYIPTDIDLELVEGTYQITPDPSKVKYHHIKFKNGDLHGHKVIVNEGISEGETIISENPLFKATYLQQYGKEAVSVTGLGKLWRIPRTPLLLFPNTVEITEDTTEKAYSKGSSGSPADTVSYEFEVVKPKIMETNQEPMILLNYGRRYQNSKEAIQFALENGTLYPVQMVPVAAHYHPSLSELEGIKPVSSAGYIPTGKTLLFKFNQVGYDWLREHSLNLTEILHYNSIVSKYNAIKLEYLGWLTNYMFNSRTLREIYTINHLGKPYKVTVDTISDFKICQHIPTVINMTSLEPVDVYCDIVKKEDDDPTVDPRSSDQCDVDNIPDISISYDVSDDTVTVVLAGLNTNPVVAVVFEISEDAENWTTLTNDSLISASFTSAGVPVYIRASVDYEDCPLTITAPLFFNSCDAVDYNAFDAEIYVNPDGSVCTKATITVPDVVPYVIVSFTVDIGAGPVAYTNETEVCGVTEDVTYTLVTEVNNCPQISRQLIVPYVVSCGDADGIGLEIEDGIRFIRTGTVPLGVIFDRIYYQGSDDGVNWTYDWLLWVGEYNVIYPYVRARRIVEFCGICPDICTPIIYWEQPI